MSIIPIALMAVGTVTSAMSAIQEGNAMSAAEKANANLSDLYASQVRQSGAYEVSKIERQKKQTQATQKARYAKSGVLITEGSPIEVMADTAAQYEMDILATRYNTEVEAGAYDYQAKYRRQMASRYRSLGYTKAFSTVLLNVGSAFIGSGFGQGNLVTPGYGGYGTNTPAGVRNMGKWSKLPGK